MIRFFKNFEKYKITCNFGLRTLNGKSNYHYGIDLVATNENNISLCDTILAIEGGVVVKCEYNNIGGNCITIRDENDVDYYYAHFRDKLKFKIGDKISKGQELGYMGNTGNSFGAHLHLGISKYGQYLNPVIFLNLENNNFSMKSLNQKGMKNNDVLVFQVLMTKLGYYTDSIDGSYGNNSIKATNKFQEKYTECGTNGKTDGSFGQKCWKKLFSLLK